MKQFKNLLLVFLFAAVLFTVTACNKNTQAVTEAKPTEAQTKAQTQAQTKAQTQAKATTKSTSKQTEEPFEPAVVYSGSVSGVFVYDEDEKIYTAIIELAQWGNIQIEYEKDEMESVIIWYDNTDIVGDVTDEDKNGADWTANLYHQDDAKSFYCCLEAGCTYEITYDPEMEELGISVYVVVQEEATEPTDESLTNQFMIANYNTDSTDYLVVYDDTYKETITLSEYTIATDANGKIIYASRTSDGYGGPADGFYHDGTYAWEAGKTCGIFSLDANFAPWEEDKEESTWTYYHVVCPTGYHIITGTKAQVAKMVKLLGNVQSYDSKGDNSLFENTIEDGSLDTYKITFTKGTTCIGIKYEIVEVIKAEGVYVDTEGTVITAMTKAEDGKYYGEYELSKWNYISFSYSNGTDAQYKIWYDTCTVLGDVTKVNYGTTYGYSILYVDKAKWYRSEDGTQKYSFTFDPATKEFSIAIKASAEGLNFVTDGTVEKNVKGEDGVYTAIVKLGEWAHIYLTYTDANGYAKPIWYTNTTISGLVTDVTADGCDDTKNLYHQKDELPGFYSQTGGDYKLVYNPTAGTLVVSEYVKKEEGLVATTEGTVIEAFSKGTDGKYVGKYTLTGWNNIALTYTDANEESKVVWYDNTTITGDVTASDKDGSAYTNVLYHEGAEKAWYHDSNNAGGDTNYVFVYDPVNSTLEISIFVEGISVTTPGTKEVSFVKGTDGKYVGIYTLTGWNSIQLTYTNANAEAKVLWYDTCTVSGDVTAADKLGSAWTNVLYHEEGAKVWYHDGSGVVGDTTYKFTYDPEAGTLAIEAYQVGISVTTTQTKLSGFEKDANGVYSGTYTLTDWNTIALAYTDVNGNTITIWYDNTTVSGTVTDSTKEGCDWTTNIFHEGEGKAWLHNGEIEPTSYKFVYDPANATLVVSVFTIGMSAETEATEYSAFSYANGVYTGSYTISNWKPITLKYTNNKGETITIWYDNTTVSGTVTDSTKEGCDWTTNIFHEGSAKAWLHNGEIEPTSYTFVYDPENATLVVSIFTPETPEASEPTDESLTKQFMIAETNKAVESYAVVYDDTYTGTITLSEYTIATDANGKIIFASCTSSGYGGPADGFYHDGTYTWTAGQVCGIFSLDADFDEYPATTEGGENAWEQYSVVCPTGYHIITGSKTSMAKLIKYLTGELLIDGEGGNGLFGSTVEKGDLDDYHFTFTAGTTCVGINVVYARAEGMYMVTDSTAVTAMAKAQDGKYYGEYTLAQWKFIKFNYSNGTTEKTLWYDTCTVLGDVVTQDTDGTYGQGILYIDNTRWYRSESGDQNYLFTYDPIADTLTVSIKRSAEGLYAVTGASNTTQVTKDDDGNYTLTVTLGEWGGVYLDYCDADGNVKPIWFNNTTISGKVLAANVTGCNWENDIYHENNTSSKFMTCTGGTYTFVYNPTAGTLVISVADAE